MIYIIPCGAKKRDGEHKAIELYTGPYFRACKAYALRRASINDIYILSAKYGLVPANKKIETYDQKMTDKGHIPKGAVKIQAAQLGLLEEEVVAIGGKAYVNICRYIWPRAITPLDNVKGGMGNQMKWLREN